MSPPPSAAPGAPPRAAARRRAPTRTLGAAAVALGATLAFPSPGRAAPTEPSVETTVLGLEAEPANELAARALTNALRQQVLGSEEYALRGESPLLVVKAGEAKCPLKRLRRPLREASDRVFDAPCLKRIGIVLGGKRFFWGHLYNEGGRPFVKVHLWREGEPDRVAILPDDEAGRDRLAERLFRKLTAPEKVGDVALTTAAPVDGELYVDGKRHAPFKPKIEVTLPRGEHLFEVRRGGKPVAWVRARVFEGRAYDVRLEPVAEAPAPRPPPRPRPARPAAAGRAPSVAPWVFGGVAVAGLAGAGAFFALYRGAQGELDDACAPDKRCRGQQDAIDRSKLYSALSLASLGVAAGAGVGAVLSWRAPRREAVGPAPPARAWAGVGPIGGGAAAFVRGEF